MGQGVRLYLHAADAARGVDVKPKILVIEDNEQNLYLMNFMLEKNGYEVVQARDGLSRDFAPMDGYVRRKLR